MKRKRKRSGRGCRHQPPPSPPPLPTSPSSTPPSPPSSPSPTPPHSTSPPSPFPPFYCIPTSPLHLFNLSAFSETAFLPICSLFWLILSFYPPRKYNEALSYNFLRNVLVSKIKIHDEITLFDGNTESCVDAKKADFLCSCFQHFFNLCSHDWCCLSVCGVEWSATSASCTN